MRKRLTIIFITVIFLLLTVLFLRFVVGGNEDDWRCVGGQWVRHGVPRAPMPTGACD